MEITKKSVLLEALEYFENQLRACSKNGMMLEPMFGFSERFDEYRKKAEVIREIIHALDSEPVRRSIANWQIELMNGKTPDITRLDARNKWKQEG